MKAPGTIRITIKRKEGDYPPGVLVVERADGKGNEEVVSTLIEGFYTYNIALTEDNLEVAKRFWLRKGCDVVVDEKPIVNPFKREEYDAWYLESNKEVVEAQKKIKTLEAEQGKIEKSLSKLQEEIKSEEALYLVELHTAKEKKKGVPPKPEGLLKAEEAYTNADKRLKQVQQEIEVLKGGLPE